MNFKNNKSYIYIIKLFLTILLFANACHSHADNSVDSALSGKWVQISGTVNGNPQYKNAVESSYFSFLNNTFSYTSSDGVNSGSTKTNGNKTSGSIDLIFNKGKAAGNTTYGVYKIKDNILYISVLKEKISGSSIPEVGACNCSAEMQFRRQTSSPATERQKTVSEIFDSSFSEDFFVGKYVSESRDNFGADEYGKYSIDVTKNKNGYLLSYSKDLQPFFNLVVGKCSEKALKIEYYHSFSLPGDVHVLCGDNDSVQFFYAQNGIRIPERGTIKGAIYKTKYYANVQFAIYGFKKIK